MNEIFISYKVYNRATAIQYFKLLREQGYSVWFDQLIDKNKSWSVAIREHIKKCKVFLCLLSQECLKDDWVLNQLYYARKYHKKIIFLAIEDIDVKAFKTYKLEEYYTSFEDLDFSSIIADDILTEYKYLTKEFKKVKHFPFFLIGLLSITAIYLICYGFQFFNLSIGKEYGYLLIGLLATILISFIPKRLIYFVVIAGYITLMGLTLYWVPPYYISDIKMNVLVMTIVLIFTLCFRYSKYNGVMTFVSSILYTALAVIIAYSLMLFFENILHIDFSIVNLGILLFVLGMKYNSHKSYCFVYEQLHTHIQHNFG